MSGSNPRNETPRELELSGQTGQRRRTRGGARTPPLHRWADGATEALVYFMVVFSPWAFGTTQSWAVWTMNVAGYVLGALLVTKRLVRWGRGYAPARWDTGAPRWPAMFLGTVTIVLLAWCLVSAVNARATVNLAEARYEYRDRFIAWLPHSYDAPSTWFAFWQYLGLAASFWAIRDWLLGKTGRERREEARRDSLEPADGFEARERSESAEAPAPQTPSPILPARLRRLLWAVCLNGALVALEGILQRLDGTDRLLWLANPAGKTPAESLFGPYAYRANAAQYLNLVWPVCLGFWWTLREALRHSLGAAVRAGSSPHVMLIPVAAVIIAASIMAGSRGGALVTLGTLIATAGLLLTAGGSTRRASLWVVSGLILVGAVAGGALGGHKALNRLLARQTAFPTGVDSGVTDFTLRCVFECPAASTGPAFDLAMRLSSELPDHNRTAIIVGSTGDRKALLVFLQGQQQNRAWVVFPRFASEFAGRVVDLVVVKSNTNVIVYVNGAELAGTQSISGSPPWTNRFGSAILHVDHYPKTPSSTRRTVVHRASFYPVPLARDQVVALATTTENLQKGDRGATNVPMPALELDRTQLERPAPLRAQLYGRTRIHQLGWRMAADFVWFGSGPGTFGPLYQIYRMPPYEWQWYAHNDWLESRITFGRIGLALALAAVAVAVLRPLARGGIQVRGVFLSLVWTALGGCLIHARFDYPLQVHSVAFLFLIWSAVCFAVTRRV